MLNVALLTAVILAANPKNAASSPAVERLGHESVVSRPSPADPDKTQPWFDGEARNGDCIYVSVRDDSDQAGAVKVRGCLRVTLPAGWTGRYRFGCRQNTCRVPKIAVYAPGSKALCVVELIYDDVAKIALKNRLDREKKEIDRTSSFSVLIGIKDSSPDQISVTDVSGRPGVRAVLKTYFAKEADFRPSAAQRLQIADEVSRIEKTMTIR